MIDKRFEFARLAHGGELVMMSINGQWVAVLTTAEPARNEEFERIFNLAQQGK